MTTIETFEDIDLYAWRSGYKWTINECLRLEREFDLLELSVPEMALLHKRTINAIMCKLQDEGLDTFQNLYMKTYGTENWEAFDLNYEDEEEEEEEEEEEDDDEEYIPDLNEDDADEEEDDDEDDDEAGEDAVEEDFSNEGLLLRKVKSIQSQINSLLSYFSSQTKSKANVSTNTEQSCNL
jgi:hypothetical protein